MTATTQAFRTLLISACSALFALGAASTAHAQGATGLSISENGVATFSHPIAVPPGISGMQPSLGLFYSGGGINGPVGQGWSVQGLSVITRCPMTIAIDGRKSRVNYTANDQFCLDGQRLIRVNQGPSYATNPADVTPVVGGTGYDGASATEYRTEKDSFARIQAFGGSAATGPAYFRVWTKAGQVSDYGNMDSAAGGSVDSKSNIKNSLNTVTIAWAVTRIKDVVGNAMDFEYSVTSPAWGTGPTAGAPTVGREWNIKLIKYGNGLNRVQFDYEDRTDKAETYHAGSKNVNTQRLKGISTFAAGQALPTKYYKLTYNEQVAGTNLPTDRGIAKASDFTPVTERATNRSLLTSIRECSADPAAPGSTAKCLPPTRFTYSAGGDLSYQEAEGFSLLGYRLYATDGSYGVLTGDFDGDGKTDLLRWSRDKPATENVLLFSDPTIDTNDKTLRLTFAERANKSGARTFNVPAQLFAKDGCIKTIAADFNGDGKTDLFRYAESYDGTNATSPCTSPVPKPILYISNGDGSFTANEISNVLFRKQDVVITSNCCDENGNYFGVESSLGRNFHFLDFNGDGYLDVMLTYQPGYFLNYSDNLSTESDPCSTNNPCTVLWKGGGTGSNFFSLVADPAAKLAFTRSYTSSKQPIKAPIDVDGAGLTDFANYLGSLPTDDEHTTMLSDGMGGFSVVASGFTQGLGCGRPDFADVNGDGKPDMFCSGRKPSTPNSILIGQGAGKFSSAANFNLSSAENEFDWGVYPEPLDKVSRGIVTNDFNGDGCADILRWKDFSSANALFLSNCDGTYTEIYQSKGFNLGYTDTGAPVQLSHSDGKNTMVFGDFTGRGQLEILRLANDLNVPTVPMMTVFNVPASATLDSEEVEMVVVPRVAGVAGAGEYKYWPLNSSDRRGNRLYFKSRVEQPDQLIQVISPTGAFSRIEYQSLAAADSASYAKGSGAVYPNIDLQPPMWVVKRVWNDAGQKDATGIRGVSNTFAYEGLMGTHNGRGLQGFRTFKKTTRAADGTSRIVTSTTYAQEFPYTGLPLVSTVTIIPKDAESGTEVSSSTNVYRDRSAVADAADIASAGANECSIGACTATGKRLPGDTTPTKIVKPFAWTGEEKSKDLSGVSLPTVTTVSEYNAYGDPKRITVTTSGTVNAPNGASAQTITKTTTNNYDNPVVNVTQWRFGRLTSASVTSSLRTNGAADGLKLPRSTGTVPIPPLPGIQPLPLSPAAMAAIFQLLLDD